MADGLLLNLLHEVSAVRAAVLRAAWGVGQHLTLPSICLQQGALSRGQTQHACVAACSVCDSMRSLHAPLHPPQVTLVLKADMGGLISGAAGRLCPC